MVRLLLEDMIDTPSAYKMVSFYMQKALKISNILCFIFVSYKVISAVTLRERTRCVIIIFAKMS